MSSSNAKCISIRGGTKTSGFKPITDYISETAKYTISLADKINSTALMFSISSVEQQRTQFALHEFSKIIARIDNQIQIDRLKTITDTLNKKINTLRHEQYNACKLLIDLFDDISRGIRAIKIIVINSRTEASRAEEHQAYLFSIADDLDLSSEKINLQIKSCRDYLYDLNNMIG